MSGYSPPGRAEFPDGAVAYAAADAWPLVTVRFPDGGQADFRAGSQWPHHVLIRYEGLDLNGISVSIAGGVDPAGKVLSLALSRTGVAGADGGLEVPAKVREKAEALCRRRAREARAACGFAAGRARGRA